MLLSTSRQMKATKNIEAWLSLVERYIRDVEVAGSNPVASIYKKLHRDRWNEKECRGVAQLGRALH